MATSLGEFKPVKLCLEIDLVSPPACAEELVNTYMILIYDNLHTVVWFQVFLSDTYNVYTILHSIKYFSLIQIITCFKVIIPI